MQKSKTDTNRSETLIKVELCVVVVVDEVAWVVDEDARVDDEDVRVVDEDVWVVFEAALDLAGREDVPTSHRFVELVFVLVEDDAPFFSK